MLLFIWQTNLTNIKYNIVNGSLKISWLLRRVLELSEKSASKDYLHTCTENIAPSSGSRWNLFNSHKYLPTLTFPILLANSADDKLMIFFLFFSPENRLWNFMQMVSSRETICMKWQSLFSWENTKNISKSSVETFTQHVKHWNRRPGTSSFPEKTISYIPLQ